MQGRYAIEWLRRQHQALEDSMASAVHPGPNPGTDKTQGIMGGGSFAF